MGCNIWAMGTTLQLFFLVALANGDVLTYSKLQDNQESSRASKVSPGLSVANGGASDFQCKRNGVFPVPGFCRDFYQCDELPGYGLISTVFSCPLGTVFDDILNNCNLVSQVTTRPECTGEAGAGTKVRANEFDALIDVPVNGPPALNRQKRIAIMTVLTGLIALGSLAGAAGGITSSVIANKKRGVGGIDLSGIENKLSGIDGKLKDINLSILESQIENKINSETTQNLINKGMNENRANFELTQNIVSQGILSNRINAAITQGLIIQGNAANDLNFAKIQVSIGELKEFIGQQMSKSKSEIRKGFESVSTAIDQSRIEPLVSKLLTLIKNFSQRLNHLQGLPEKNHRDEIERRGGYLEYLQSSTIQDTLYDIIHQNFAVPISASDISAVFILDLLVQGLQIHASMMSSIVSSYVYLATKSLNERNVDEFNTYMLRVSSSTSRMKLSLGCIDTHGLIDEVKSVLQKVKQLPYASRIHGLNDLLSEKETELGLLESDITEYINENIELDEPGQILGKPDFSISSPSVLIGPWENGKQVSYAIQFVSDKGLSPIGEWSRPYTILDQANPIIHLPSAEDGVMRFVYRRFNEETPELVAIMTDNEHTSFRDMGRDIINAASRSNEELAVSEVRALLDEGADVNVTLENKMTPLHYASKYGNTEVMKILANETADIHVKSLDDEEALHFAALSGAEEAVAYLINEGAFINAQTKLLSWSPLHIAVANNHVGATTILIQNGAFINIKDNKGLTPLHLSILGNGETMEVLLEEERLNVNAKADDGQTPLHYAARSSSAYFVKKLLEHRDIEVNALSDRHLSPLHYAAMGGNVEIVTELIQQEASVSLVDTYGSTPLHYAAFYGNTEAVFVLIEKDHSLKSVKNIEEKTAFDLANENNKTDVIQILRNETEYLINKIKEEITKIEQSKDSITESTIADQAVSVTSLENVNCTRQDVQEMAVHSEETCVHIGHITDYVNVVMSKLPLVVQYEVEKSFTNIINNYNRGLEDAKRNANFWRNRDSILGSIQQTFKLAKDFEPTFNRKYKIKQERVAHHSQHTDENEMITKVKGEISKLEEDLRAAQEAIVQVAAPGVKQFIENSIRNLEKELETKRNIISVDPTTIRILEELTDFLEFVKDDASEIKQKAVNTKRRTVTFRNNLNADRELFERNSQNARHSLKQLQRQSIGNNIELTYIQRTQDRLQTDIEAQKRQISQLYDNMYKTQKELRDKRRELLKKMEKVSNKKLVFTLITSVSVLLSVTPIAPAAIPIGTAMLPLKAIANAADRELITAWQNNISENKVEAARLETAAKINEKLIGQYREQIANGSRNSDTLIRELNTFNKLDRDLQNIVVEIPSLQPSISQAIVGLEKIEEVFNTVTQELSEMIDVGKAANTATEKENALNSIHIRLSELQCYWKDISLYVVDLKQCSKNYNLVQPKQSLKETGH